jgi:hypothetical protein
MDMSYKKWRNRRDRRRKNMSTSYIQKVLRTQSSSFVGFWPLNEESGTVAYDLSPNGYNATSSGLLRSNVERSFLGPDGGKCAKFDGSASYIDLVNAGAASATTEGTVSIWAAIEDNFLGGTTAGYIFKAAVDTNNHIQVFFNTQKNSFTGSYKGGGTAKNVTSSPLVYNIGYGAQWHHYALTYSATADTMKFYSDGLQQGSTQTSLGTWSGSFASDLLCLGCSDSSPVADLLPGWLARFGWWNKALTGDEVADLAVAGP